jgi:hypothetical protein
LAELGEVFLEFGNEWSAGERTRIDDFLDCGQDLSAKWIVLGP